MAALTPMSQLPHISKRHRLFLPAITIMALTFLLFSPSLKYQLVDLDDHAYISTNAMVLGGVSQEGLRQAFSFKNTSATMYMPFLWISYMVDVSVWNASAQNPWGFHFTNIFLHAINSFLLFFLLYFSCRKPWRALFFALLWATHPLRVESVAWITERKDVLSGLFCLLSIGAYGLAHALHFRLQNSKASSRNRGKWLWLTGSFVCFVFGLLVKPALVPLPFLLLLLDAWPLKRVEPSWRSLRQHLPRLLFEKIPFFGAALLASFGTVFTHHMVAGTLLVPLEFRLLTIPLTYCFYLYKMVFPFRLTVLYPPYIDTLLPGLLALFFIPAGLFLLTITGFIARAYRAKPNMLIGWLWFCLLLLPVCGIISIPTNDVADRFTYLPSIGFSIALLFACPFPRSIRSFRTGISFIFSVLLLMGLSFLTARQLPAWQNSSALYKHVLSVYPHHVPALESCLQQMIHETGHFEQVEEWVTDALERNPHHEELILTKAHCLAELGNPALSLQWLQTKPSPSSKYMAARWHLALARYSLMCGQYEEASTHATQASSYFPAHDFAQIPLLLLAMTAAYENNQPEKALQYAHAFPPYSKKTAITLLDTFPHVIFQWAAGYRRDANRYFRRFLLDAPHQVDVLNNITWGLATANWSATDAEEILHMAHRLTEQMGLENPGILDTLAAAQANAGDFEAAMRTLETAIRLFPENPTVNQRAFKERLYERAALYRQGRPYREDAFNRLYAITYGKLTPSPISATP
ncbi:MAG: hypothetical protein LBN38_06180 [Verrucomicrobiota bacterium]|jgi:tetratricopeptide (TPR) repeat protein|nr:hypothetical protein [Verrucomicrobiota bacterium]